MADTLLASQDDLENSLGRVLTDAETPKAQSALRYASNLVRAMAPWVDSLASVPGAVNDVVVSLAERRLVGPRNGVSSRTVGQVQESYLAPGATFTHDELLLLRTALGISGSTTVSIAGPDAVNPWISPFGPSWSN